MMNTHNNPPKTRSLTGHKSMKITALVTAGILGTAMASQAAIYTQDFTNTPTSTLSGGAQLYGAGNDVEDQEFGFGSHSSGGQSTTFHTGEMVISAFDSSKNGNTYGSATALYLDTASWAAGAYTVTFDVANYEQGADDSHFGVYQGNNDGTLRLRVNNGNSGSEVYPLEDTSSGTVTFGEIGLGEQITTGVSSISYDFTLTAAGNTGDYLVLGWGTRSGDQVGGVFSDSFNIDNIVVSAVPEPSSAALLGLGGVALILRRRK